MPTIRGYFVHGALAHVGAHDVYRGRGASFLEERQGILELAELFPGQNSQLLELAAVALAAIGLAHVIERMFDVCHRLGVGLQVGAFARQQIAALAGLGVGYEGNEFAQGLLPHLRIVHAFVGGVEPGLPGRREEKKADQKADQQQRRQGDVPSTDFAQFLAQDFHVMSAL